MRDNVCELALGLPATRLSNGAYYSITAALVVGAYAISIFVPSIYVSGAGLS